MYKEYLHQQKNGTNSRSSFCSLVGADSLKHIRGCLFADIRFINVLDSEKNIDKHHHTCTVIQSHNIHYLFCLK